MLNRVLLVNKRLQLAVMVYSIALALCMTLANFIIQLTLLNVAQTANQPKSLILILGGLFLVFSIAVIFGFALTNRIAGPIFRLGSHMKDGVEGKKIEEVKFRENDYFAEVLTPYNALLRKLRDLQSAK